MILRETPKAKNDKTAFENYKFRNIYNDLFPMVSGPTLLNTWEHTLYGKVNYKNEPIMLASEDKSLSFMKSPSGDVSHKILTFMYEIYFQFKRYIDTAIEYKRVNMSDVDGELLKLEIKRGYVSPQSLYINYHDTILTDFKENDSDFRRSINKNIEVYMFKALKLQLDHTMIFPMTLSSFIKSTRCPNLMSGFAFEISDIGYDNDERKFDDFINNNNFLFVRDAAKKFGLKIDQNVPWRFLADLRSPALGKFLSFAGLTKDTIFDKLYIKAAHSDILALKTVLLGFYNRFSTQRRFTMSELNEVFDDNFWLKMYVAFRIKEEKKDWNTRQINNFTVRTSQVHFLLDTPSAIDYINNSLNN